ncbi:transposase, Ptta/En/Spm, transposase, Tnp1/En/Spm-like protein [Tanacetum coccineum]
MPRGTTQVVTRGASNDWCAGTVAVRGGGWTNQRVTRGTLRVSVRGRHVSVRAEEMERNRVDKETMQMLQEMIKIQEEKRIFEEAARQEDEKRIAIEKEAAELEAKRKSQECLNIEEKSIPQASIRSRKSRIDPTLRNFTISTKRIPFSTVKTVNSLKMGDKHLDTQKGSLESSVKDPIPIPSESDVISDGDCDDDYQKRFDLKVQQLWMPSIYDENNKIRECYIIRPSAITPDLPIPDSLIMEDEHLDTIPVTESANTIKSSVEELVPTPSESADLSDDERECDVPVNDESSPTFATFSNPLFDSKDDFTSSDNESFSDEDVPKENFKIYSNPLFDEEIISTKIDPHCFNAESYLIESLLNRDTLIDSSPKFDYLLEEFSGELAHTDPIPPGVVDTDSEPEEEIRLAENLSYDNSSPRPPEERNSEIADTIVESLSPPPIPVEDSDSLMEEIDLFLASDDSMPPGIEIDDYDSEGDIRFLEELLSNDSPPLPENESFSLDHFDDPSLPRPPPEPPDVEICFNFEPDAGVVTKKVVGDISEHDVLMPNLLPTQPTLCPVFDLLLPFSSENEDKVFKPAQIWLDKEPPRSILTWDDLVSKFINKFFPPSKTTNLRNEITRFQQRFDESFYEAWDRFNDLLRACPHHEFSELHQLDTFYNALNTNDQDLLNSAAGGNFSDKMP